MALIEREPCYIYSMREYQEHSLILEAISLNLGAIAILARGAKRPDSPLQGLFQPFTPLLLSLQLGQKGDLYYLKDYEYCPGGYHFVIPESFCAFYLNELLHLLYHGKESDKLLFGHYIATLEAIEHKDNIEHHLRSFELHLLKSLGYAISPLDEQGDPVKADQSYRFCFGIGFVEVDPEFMAQVMRSQSQKTTAAPAPVPQPEPDAENAMLFAKSKIRGPKMAESRPSQAPGQDAWVKRALEQGFASSVIQRYYEYGADLLGPILTGAEIQDIVSLECKLPHSAHNAKLLTASVINRLTGGVELNSRKLYREYLHLCKQKQAAAQAPAPAPAAPGAAPAPAPAVVPAAAPAPTQVVAPMASAPQLAASAVAAPAPSTVPTEPQMTAPVASAGPETNSAPVTSLEIAEPAVENEQVADAEAVQASREEIVAASPELETEATSSLETSSTAAEGESEAPAEPEANPAPVASLETGDHTAGAKQGAGAEFAQESQDETVAASPELETKATSSLETSSTAAEGESEAPAEPETTPTLETSLETAEPVVEAEQVAGADMAQVSQEVTVEASTDAETDATSSLETSATAFEGESEDPAELETNSAPEASLETGEPTVETEQVAGADEAQSSQEETVAASPEPEANQAPEASLETGEPTLEAEQVAYAESAQASQEATVAASAEPEANQAPEASLETAASVVEVEHVAGAEATQVSQNETIEASTDSEASAELTAKVSKKAKSTKSVKRKSKKTDLAEESDQAVTTVALEKAQAQASESSEAPAKPKRSTKAKSGKGTKSTSAKGTKAKTSSKRSARQRAAEADVAGTVESSQQDEPEPEVITQGPEIEALDDELLVLAPQVIEPEVPANPVKAKKVKKLTRAQLKAKAKVEAEARVAAEQERMATSPYDESMLMMLDASLTKRRRKKPSK